jgi:bifunctional UDP-N-acetylglucosamine pyrophosphorylase/glucosamine-1-phosphate N-acetyltransferase
MSRARLGLGGSPVPDPERVRSRMSLKVVVLAAGKGTRMKSHLPKVLHPVAGRPMLARVLDASRGAGAQGVVAVVSGMIEMLSHTLGDPEDVAWAIQEEQLGTGHAARMAEEAVGEAERVMIVNGDLPRLRGETLAEFVRRWDESGAECALLSTEVPDPHGYGRILREHDGRFRAIVEHRDATREQRQVREINVGIYGAPREELFAALGRAGTDNDQGEYYLTDAFKMMLDDGLRVEAFCMDPHEEFEGVNTRVQLAQASSWIFTRKAEELMLDGVTLVDPRTTYIEDKVVVGPDSLIEPGVILRGETRIGASCHIGAYSVLQDCVVEDEAEVRAHTVGEHAHVGQGALVGPFARLREGTELGTGARVGNFVETKKAKLGEGAKANHLAYLGDCEVGAGSNIGAGTITCNYDGFAKHFTSIGARVFVGSNSTLVAPVDLGDGTFVAAGSTVTKSAGKDDLVLGRARQTIKEGYAARLRSRLGGSSEGDS